MPSPIWPNGNWGPSQSHWYDPTSWDLSTDADRANASRFGLGTQAGGAAGSFAQTGEYGYNAGTADLAAQRNYLMGLASGQNSVSAEQLRQGMQQGVSAQRAMAASANPNNSAMAARNAAMNMGQLGYGLSGQQAVAGLQERNQAQQALAQLELGQRGQDLQAALGSRQNQISAYNGQPLGQSAAFQMGMGGLGGVASYFGAKSDRRAKTEIADGDADSAKALDALKSYKFKYKDPKRDGDGEQLGVMADELKKVVPSAVIDTPGGMMVHGGKAATASLALVAALGRRVSKLEGDKGKKDPPAKGDKPKDSPESH